MGIGKGLGACSPLSSMHHGGRQGDDSPRLALFLILLLALLVEKAKRSPWYS